MSRAVTVFCSSSSDIDPIHLRAATELGAAIAREGWRLVYGGNNIGSMGALADSCRAAGGKVIGVTPKLFVDKGSSDDKCHQLIVTADMRSRKEQMEELGDAFIALPGGFGTLEELSEIIVGRLLNYHSKPVIILNTAGFYAPLLHLFDTMIAGGFAREKARRNYAIASDVADAIGQLREHWSPAENAVPAAV